MDSSPLDEADPARSIGRTSTPIVPPVLPPFDLGFDAYAHGWPQAPRPATLSAPWHPPPGSTPSPFTFEPTRPSHPTLDYRDRSQPYAPPPSAVTLPMPGGSSSGRPFSYGTTHGSYDGAPAPSPLLQAPSIVPPSPSRRSSLSGSTSAHSPVGSPASQSRAPSQRDKGRGKAQGSPSGTEDDPEAKEQKRVRNAQAHKESSQRFRDRTRERHRQRDDRLAELEQLVPHLERELAAARSGQLGLGPSQQQLVFQLQTELQSMHQDLQHCQYENGQLRAMLQRSMGGLPAAPSHLATLPASHGLGGPSTQPSGLVATAGPQHDYSLRPRAARRLSGGMATDGHGSPMP